MTVSTISDNITGQIAELTEHSPVIDTCNMNHSTDGSYCSGVSHEGLACHRNERERYGVSSTAVDELSDTRAGR